MTKKIIGIYLAAGMSSRFGSNKLMMPFRESFLGVIALKAALASMLEKTIVIARENDQLQWMYPGCLNYKKMSIVQCKESSKGQSYSLKCGMRFAEKCGADAVVVLLSDQPFITTQLINQLIQEYKLQETISFICPTNNDIICPPILINRTIFHYFNQIKGDEGAKSILYSKREQGLFIESNNPLYSFDIDTKNDYVEAMSFIDKT